MAKRDRVPRRKQLDGAHRRRNKNPKLSPYQKELKRNQMANQPPVNKLSRDFPASARSLQRFLDYQREGRDEVVEDEAKPDKYGRRKHEDNDACDDDCHVVVAASTPKLKQSKNKFKQAAPEPVGDGTSNLNAWLTTDALPASENPVVKRLEKKLKVSLKKKEKRKAARIEQMHRESDRLDALVKGIATPEDLMGSAMRTTRRRKTRYTEQQAAEEAQDGGPGGDANADPTPAPVAAPAPAPAPVVRRESTTKDFTDLVDRVRFGDRNDAPPRFDVIPKVNAALLPQQHMSKVKRQQIIVEQRRAKIASLMNPDGAASPLQKLSTTPLPGGGELVAATVKGTRLESSDDFEKLRQRVMARYASKNKGSFFQRRRDTVFTMAEAPAEADGSDED